MDTNLYWTLRGTYAERKAKLSSMHREFLENAILDHEYNGFIRMYADAGEGDSKLVPYIGRAWRHIQFSDPTSIPIGDCGGYIGFMANNKWGYPERCLTGDEAAKVISIIDEAMRIGQEGGDLVENLGRIKAKLQELRQYMQTLKIKPGGQNE